MPGIAIHGQVDGYPLRHLWRHDVVLGKHIERVANVSRFKIYETSMFTFVQTGEAKLKRRFPWTLFQLNDWISALKGLRCQWQSMSRSLKSGCKVVLRDVICGLMWL